MVEETIPSLNMTLTYSFQTEDLIHGVEEEYEYYFQNIFFLNKFNFQVYYKNDWDIDYVLMSMSAHHLDLRSPNVEDPTYVVEGRKQEIEIIKKWIGKKSNEEK